MYRILRAIKDTYITDKIVRNSFRATDANVGHAGTLDLFKLYDESTLSGTVTPTELSRILVRFDLDPLRAMTGSTLNAAHSSFRCTLRLRDVYGASVTPSNFKLQVFPLSRSFDEGVGRDVGLFQDLDSANWVTASVSSGTVSAWHVTGAGRQGLLGSSDIDVISSGNLSDGSGVVNLWGEQLFEAGEEDLAVDVTRVVSGIIARQIPDHGFMVAFSGTFESDQRTYFVKRFGSRHATDTRIRPVLTVEYDDSIRDDRTGFFFDSSGSVFLSNLRRGAPANIVSGSALTPVIGLNCLVVRLMSGAFTQSFTASQHVVPGTSLFVTGVYSASFAIPSNNTYLRQEIVSAGSGTFVEVWGSLDGTLGYVTGSLVIYAPQISAFTAGPRRLVAIAENLASAYRQAAVPRIRVHIRDASSTPAFKKLPMITPSVAVDAAYYRIRDAESGYIAIPFSVEATRLSVDSAGMYFDMHVSDLDLGRTYCIDILVRDAGVSEVIGCGDVRFRVDE